MAPVTWRAEAIVELAVAAIKVGDFDRAANLCQQALKIQPEFAEAFHIRGVCLLRQERPFDALLHFDRALSINPEQYDCWNNRGIAFAEIGMWEAARDSFQKSLSCRETPEPHIMWGGVEAHLMHLDASEREFKHALAIDPDLHDLHVKLGVVLLGQGKWQEGFPHYDWRWYDVPHEPRAHRIFKKWQGEDLTGKNVLLYSEQGFGDEIMGLRWVETVKQLAKSVVVEVRPTMSRICKHSMPDVEFVAHGDKYPENIAYSCPLLNVPWVLGHTPATMPAPQHYLSLPPSLEWRERLSKVSGLKVGLCWSSGRRPLMAETKKSMKAKSILPEQLLSLLDTPGVTFVSLQIPREETPREFKILDLTDHIDDFYDTAQLVNELDLTITVDTSVAHLAGAMGKPVWNLVRFNGYWPWMVPKRSETYWYPSMEMFWQPEPGHWEPALAEVKQRLIEYRMELAA